MPIYEYFCEECNEQFDRYLPLAQYKDPQLCEKGHKATKKFSKPYIINRFESYESPITGEAITSEKRRREDLASSGCVEYEPGMRQDADAKVKDDEMRLEKEVDRTVDQLISKMPSSKLEKLQNELDGGAEIAYERRSVE